MTDQPKPPEVIYVEFIKGSIIGGIGKVYTSQFTGTDVPYVPKSTHDAEARRLTEQFIDPLEAEVERLRKAIDILEYQVKRLDSEALSLKQCAQKQEKLITEERKP